MPIESLHTREQLLVLMDKLGNKMDELDDKRSETSDATERAEI